MKKKKQIKKRLGPPLKLQEMGETHIFAPRWVPKEVLALFKTAVKTMMGSMTLSDYLRIRVVNEAARRLPGKEYPQVYCTWNGHIDWTKYSWIKDPEDKTFSITLVHYPVDAWEIFAHNCAVEGVQPAHKICGYMVDAIIEYFRYKKERKLA